MESTVEKWITCYQLLTAALAMYANKGNLEGFKEFEDALKEVDQREILPFLYGMGPGILADCEEIYLTNLSGNSEEYARMDDLYIGLSQITDKGPDG